MCLYWSLREDHVRFIYIFMVQYQGRFRFWWHQICAIFTWLCWTVMSLRNLYWQIMYLIHSFLAPPAEKQRSFSNAELSVVRHLSSSIVSPASTFNLKAWFLKNCLLAFFLFLYFFYMWYMARYIWPPMWHKIFVMPMHSKQMTHILWVLTQITI